MRMVRSTRNDWEVPPRSRPPPGAVAQALQTIITGLRVDGTVGIAFPAPIINSIVMSPANVADGWIGLAGDSGESERSPFCTILSSEAPQAYHGIVHVESS